MNSDQAAKALKKAGFPARHIANIDEMRGPGYAKASELLPRIESGDCLLVLCGDRGPGKTQIVTYWAHKMMLQVKACRYFKAHDLLTLIRRQFDDDRGGKAEAREILDAVRRCKFLAVDEFSELAGSEWEIRTLTNIIDHRYDAMLATTIVTNDKPEDAADAVGRSIWSRAEETGGIVKCDWSSYRRGERGRS